MIFEIIPKLNIFYIHSTKQQYGERTISTLASGLTVAANETLSLDRSNTV